MAITSVTGVTENDILPAFADLNVVVETDNVNVTLIKVELGFDSKTFEQYAIVFEGKAYFNLRKSLRAVFPKCDNVVQIFDEPIANNKLLAAELINHHKAVALSFSEVGEVTAAEVVNIVVIKSTELQKDVLWNTITANKVVWLPYADGPIYRTALKDQSVFLTSFSTATRNLYRNADLWITGVEQTNNYACYPFKATINAILYYAASVLEIQSNLFYLTIDEKTYPRSKTLYFINRYGAWDFYNIIDYEEVMKANKEQLTVYSDFYGTREIRQNVKNRVRELKCYGRSGRAEFLNYIQDLVTSPIVLDEDGEQVRVLDDEILIEGEGLIEPEFTIRYIELNSIEN